MGAVVERLQLLITASAKGVASEIRGVENATGGAAEKTSLLQKGLSRVGLEGANTGTIMKTALAGGIAVGGVALAKFAADGIEKFSDLTSQVRGFQRVAGTTAEESSKLVFATRELGIAPDVAAVSFGRLETRLGTGKAHLEQFGIATKNAKGETLDASQIIANISEAYQNAGSQSEKAAIGNEAFGKSWQKLAPLLGKGKEDLHDLYAEAAKDHQVFSQADLEKGRQFALATTQLKDAVTGLEIELGSALVPTVTKLTSGLTTGVQTADDATSIFGGLGGVMEHALDASPVGNFTLATKGLGDILHGDFASGVGEAAMSLVPFGGEIANVTGLFDSGSDEAETFASKQDKVKAATKAVADAVTEHGAKSKEARDAQRELTSATDDLQGAEKKVSDALTDVNNKLTSHTEKLYADQQATLLAGTDKLRLEQSISAVSSAFDTFSSSAAASAAAGDTEAEAAARQTANHQNLVGATLAAIAAAGKKASDDLGPNATAAEKMRAATAAQQYALSSLESQFPGLREQVQDYVGDLNAIPGVKDTFVHVNVNADELYALQSMLAQLTSGVHNIAVAVTGNLPWGSNR